MYSRTLIILIPLLPLLSAIICGIFGPRMLKGKSHLPVVAAIIGSFICSLLLAGHVRSQIVAGADQAASNAAAAASGGTIGVEEVHTLWTWANVPDLPDANEAVRRDFKVDVSLRVDPLTVIMLMMVTFIGSLVAIYASGYMHDDPGYWRFFAYVGLFVFSMTMLVSVSNFLLLFVFWEAVGACSYLLIGFWYEKPEAAAAGKKAFLVNRVGDFGFALAIFLIFLAFGTLNFHDADGIAGVFGQTRLAGGMGISAGLATAICVLLMLGACGKSAQFPLHVWLPDAMEGPTPVSALIHAATMVTAGVYMVCRCTPLFLSSPTAQITVACIGAGTALMAGLIALTQYDLKRVLAYSTVSQLGYMFLAMGTGTLAGITAGMFHLFTHAFFKALLFLGAGSVMHSMGGVIDMRRFGGLRKLMPITHWTFLAGCLALSGLFPFSGFWSKDAIVGAVHDQAEAMTMELSHRAGTGDDGLAGHASSTGTTDSLMLVSTDGGAASGSGHAGGHGHQAVTTAHLSQFTDGELKCGAAVYPLLYYASLFTAFLTAVYTFRAFFMTFYGEEDIPHEAGHHAHESPPSMWIPLAILSVFALAIGVILEKTHAFANLLGHTPSLSTLLAKSTPQPGVFHMNIAIISTVVAAAAIFIAAFLYLGNQREVNALRRMFDSSLLGRPYRWSLGKFFWDEIYDWTIVKPMHGLSKLSYAADRFGLDGLVNLTGWLPKGLGGALRRVQNGLVPLYGLAMVIGVLILLAARTLMGGQ